ncbi:MAG: replication-associated recombination protein A [Deltaproteobacteria bacterium]
MDLFDRLKKPSPVEGTIPGGVPPAPADAPLADRMRPRVLEELVGHQARLGPETPLGRAILADRAPSMVLWGPPGVGKTTVARIVAAYSRARFQQLSAVMAGVADIRATIAQAEAEKRAGRKTILFVDEIHRFNKAQQDALLPHVENGTVTLIGATTENPSFALVSALLSRAQVVRLEPLESEALKQVIARALGDSERGLGGLGVTLDPEALAALARWADGDGRRALTLLEHLVTEVHARGLHLATREDVEAAARDRTLRYDKDGEEHHNLVSAFIKSLRGSDPDGALYWCVRMIEAGDDPLFVLRRMLIFAAEDVGLADPRAMEIVAASDHAFQRIGLPEGMIPIAFAVTYLAVTQKSKAAYNALGEVREEIARSGALPVPMRLRNAATSAMKSWGYGEGYKNPQVAEGGFVAERYLPDALGDRVFYRPTQRGLEARVSEHLARLRGAVTAATATATSTTRARSQPEPVHAPPPLPEEPAAQPVLPVMEHPAGSPEAAHEAAETIAREMMRGERVVPQGERGPAKLRKGRTAK